MRSFKDKGNQVTERLRDTSKVTLLVRARLARLPDFRGLP